MIPNPLQLDPHGNRRLTGIALALLALLAGATFLSAQGGDTPIVIGDGSLTMESAVPWSSFAGSGATHGHPHGNKSVTGVDVAMPGLSHTVTFDGEKAEVNITYAGNFNIKVSTGENGRRLAVNTDFASFRQGADANHLVHSNPSGTITHVTVIRHGAVAFDSAASGHTRVTIHYQ